MTDKTDILTLTDADLQDPPAVAAKTPVILPDGRRGFLHPSGAIRNEQGHYLVKPPWSAGDWSGGTAVAAGKKAAAVRWERTRELMRAAIAAKMAESGRFEGVPGPEAAFSEAVGDIFQEVLDGKGQLNERRLALAWLGVAADLLPDPDAVRRSSGDGAGFDPGAVSVFNKLFILVGDRLDGLNIAHDNNTNQDKTDVLPELGAGGVVDGG